MKSKSVCWFVIMAIFLFIAAGFVEAYDIVIRPPKAVVQPGAGVHFEAQAFTENGIPVFPRQYDWKVVPENLGRITDDGFFMAGREHGRGEVLASALLGGELVVGKARIQVGAPVEPDIQLVIRPDESVVAPADSRQFKALAVTRFGRIVPVDAMRWLVVPNDLGSIDTEGLFVAGNKILAGQVIAIAEIGKQKYRAEADVLVAPEPNSGIAGTVVNELGNPLAEAVITAYRLGPVRWHNRTTTDANGNYLLPNLIPGLYVIRAVVDGYLAEFYDNKQYMKEATPVTVAENDTTTGIDFSLEHGAFISGTVVSDLDNGPLPGTHVVAIRLTDKLMRHALTDEDGHYLIGALENGTYVVLASKDGYKEEYYNDKPRLEQADLITVTVPDTTTGIHFSLGIRSAVMGIVTEEVTGLPLEGACVLARPVTLTGVPPNNLPCTRTDAHGQYTLELRPGSYYLHTFAAGFTAEFYDNAQDIASATVVQVSEDQHTIDINFALARLGAIAGKVQSQEDNRLLAGALVKAFREGPGWEPKEVATDSLGNYLIENVPAGNYVVKAWGKSYLPEYYQEAEKPADATIVVVANADTTENINFTLNKGGMIAGTVYSADDNTPLAGALIKLTRVNSRFLQRKAVSDNEGKYEIDGLATGDYIVQAMAKKHITLYYDNVLRRQQATVIKIAAPQKVENIDFKLTKRLRKNSAITGLVVDETDNSPIYGALVMASRIGGRPVAMGFTEPDGQYELDNLNPGSYIVYVAARGYVNEFYDNVLRWWQAAPVRIGNKETTENINFALMPHSDGVYLISGMVTDGVGNRVEGALIFAETETGVSASTVTDEDGAYVLDGLNAGIYKVRASLADYQETFVGGSGNLENATNITVGRGQDYSNADITLSLETGVGQELSSTPDHFALQQNYPNPFNPSTTIRFDLPREAKVTIEIYNLLGQKVRILLSETRPSGRHSVTWDGKNDLGAFPSSGMYFYRIEARAANDETFSQTYRMVLLK